MRTPVVSIIALLLPTRLAATTCDLFAAGNTPCVAAYSLTRALFAGYDGPLYRVHNGDTDAEMDVGVVAAGGAADAAAQERFCGAALCVVQRIYDQSPLGNHLGPEHGASYLPPPRNSKDVGVNMTTASRVTLGGAPVYSAVFDSHCKTTHGSCDGLVAGYSNRTAAGTPVDEEPQTVYALYDGRHFNTGCCFEFGNAEKTAVSYRTESNSARRTRPVSSSSRPHETQHSTQTDAGWRFNGGGILWLQRYAPTAA